jgi:arylformamidase
MAPVKIIDLTQAMANGMPVMPGIMAPQFHDLANVATDGYAMSQYTFINHTGTHVDAPAHQVAGGATLDDIPLDRLVTEAVTIDLSEHKPGPVGVADVAAALELVQAGDIVLFRSDNAQNWGTDAYWHGWCYPDADAAGALVRAGVSGVGFDGPSADPVDSTDYRLHQVWLSAGAIILENLTGLDQLPARCRIVVAPLKVSGANGGPARVLALLDD